MTTKKSSYSENRTVIIIYHNKDTLGESEPYCEKYGENRYVIKVVSDNKDTVRVIYK